MTEGASRRKGAGDRGEADPIVATKLKKDRPQDTEGVANEEKLENKRVSQEYKGSQMMNRKCESKEIPCFGHHRANTLQGTQLAILKVDIIGKEWKCQKI